MTLFSYYVFSGIRALAGANFLKSCLWGKHVSQKYWLRFLCSFYTSGLYPLQSTISWFRRRWTDTIHNLQQNISILLAIILSFSASELTGHDLHRYITLNGNFSILEGHSELSFSVSEVSLICGSSKAVRASLDVLTSSESIIAYETSQNWLESTEYSKSLLVCAFDSEKSSLLMPTFFQNRQNLNKFCRGLINSRL